MSPHRGGVEILIFRSPGTVGHAKVPLWRLVGGVIFLKRVLPSPAEGCLPAYFRSPVLSEPQHLPKDFGFFFSLGLKFPLRPFRPRHPRLKTPVFLKPRHFRFCHYGRNFSDRISSPARSPYELGTKQEVLPTHPTQL